MAVTGVASVLPERVRAGERVVLRPSRRRRLGVTLLGLLAALLAAAGAVQTLQGSAWGLALLVPGAPLALYWLAAATPRSTWLAIDRDGFEARQSFVGHRWSWNSVSGFGVRTIDYRGGGSITLVSFTSRDRGERPADWLQELAIRGLIRTTTLPDPYGEQARELAAGMEACRAEFGTAVLSPASLGVRGKRETPLRAAVDANDEIPSVAVRSGVPEATVNEVLEAHYDYLSRHEGEPIDPGRESISIAQTTSVDADTAGRVLAAQLDYLDGLGLVGD
jgi:hypothetical protein